MFTVYKTTNLLNGMWYIGVHRTYEPMDGYLGSGVAIKRAVKKYGPDNFKKEILCSFDDAELAYFVEAHYVTEKEIADRNCYNMTLGGSKPPVVKSRSEETRRKISAARMGMKRKPFTEEARKNMSAARKGKTPALGLKHSAESKRKISEASKLMWESRNVG